MTTEQNFAKEYLSQIKALSLQVTVKERLGDEEELKEAAAQLVFARKQISEEISRLKSPVYREFLTLRYIDLLPLASAAEVMHYSYEWIRQIHKKALAQFYDAILKSEGGV